MKNIKFVLENKDVSDIVDALNKLNFRPDLVGMFAALEMQQQDITLSTGGEEPVYDFETLLDDLGLVRNQPEIPDQREEVVFDDFIHEDFDANPEVEHLSLSDIIANNKDKAKQQACNSINVNGVATPIRDVELDPKVRMMSSAEEKDESATPDPKADVVEPEARVVAGWDSRVPKPKPDPTLMSVETKTPTEAVVEPETPEEAVVTPTEACDVCGGFTESNPHKDPSMNCDCKTEEQTETPYEVKSEDMNNVSNTWNAQGGAWTT